MPVFDKEDAAATFETRQQGLPSCLACRAAAVKTMAMAMAKAKFAAPPGAGKVDDGAGSLLRASGSAILSDRVLDGTSFDAPPGAVTIRCIWCNAVSDRVEEIGPRGAPPGAATIAASSGSLLRTSGSSAGASIGTPLCFCSSALCILSIKADCAPLPSRVGVRAKGDDTFFIATKERESSSYLCPGGSVSVPVGWRATSLRPIVVMVGHLWGAPSTHAYIVGHNNSEVLKYTHNENPVQ